MSVADLIGLISWLVSVGIMGSWLWDRRRKRQSSTWTAELVAHAEAPHYLVTLRNGRGEARMALFEDLGHAPWWRATWEDGTAAPMRECRQAVDRHNQDLRREANSQRVKAIMREHLQRLLDE